MNRILFVNACVRENSRTLRLARRALSRFDGEITEVNLQSEAIPSLTADALRRREANDPRANAYAREFAAADAVVIAAPFWDLSFPAALKCYFEAINVSGVTFTYREGVPVPLCRLRKLLYVTTAGGPYMGGFGFAYAEALARFFYGAKDIRCVFAENLDVDGADTEAILRAAERRIDEIPDDFFR